MTLKIEAGKFYRTRDGRKVGPMRSGHYNPGADFPFDVAHGTGQFDPDIARQLWNEDGYGDEGLHLVAECTEDRPSMTLPNGDVIYEGEYGVTRKGKKVGPMRRVPDEFGEPFVWFAGENGAFAHDGEDGSAPGDFGSPTPGDIIAKWRDEAETPAAEPSGPVTTVTVKRIVPGVYGRVNVAAVDDGGLVQIRMVGGHEYHGLHTWWTAAELTDAISTLTAIRDAMEGGAQ